MIKKCVVQRRALNQALNHRLIFKKYTVIQLNQEAWLKPYIEMNNILRKEAKKWFWERFFQINE